MTIQQVLKHEAHLADTYGYNDATHNSREERHAFALEVLTFLEQQEEMKK